MNYAKDLINFIDHSPTMFQATAQLKKRLDEAGFEELSMTQIWSLNQKEGYYVSFNDSSLIAFRIGTKDCSGFHLIGAHTDSPLLKIKPSPMITSQGYTKLNVEIYGGPLLDTWFDRPLSLAGRVILDEKTLLSLPVDLKRELLIIPSLAIHLSKDEKGDLNPQKELLPLFSGKELEEESLLQLLAEELGIGKEMILDYELYCYPTEKGCFIGEKNEFISIGRLDNLGMCHAGLQALIEASPSNRTQVLACFDNEEVGSLSAQGAGSGLLRNVLHKISLSRNLKEEEHLCRIYDSFMMSCDQAHGVHPNYEEKADPTNRPKLGGGPVIKISARKAYTSDALGIALCKKLCKENNIPYQTFANPSDMRGGSTIGPISEGQTSIKGMDLGIALLGMHSVRELQAAEDQGHFISLLRAFLEH
ncbi:MAG: M18 family aminopeptidase [Tissierellia bacterium]|nr:M18 family aminopeptidase [Tissierellia bacterium]